MTTSHNSWKVLFCEATGKKWSNFTVMKSEMVERACAKSQNIPVNYICLDSASKNQKLAKHAASSDWAVLHPLDFEFTSQDTPQHNSLAELAFPYLAENLVGNVGNMSECVATMPTLSDKICRHHMWSTL